jgi:hypothetical protein
MKITKITKCTRVPVIIPTKTKGLFQEVNFTSVERSINNQSHPGVTNVKISTIANICDSVYLEGHTVLFDLTFGLPLNNMKQALPGKLAKLITN